VRRSDDPQATKQRLRDQPFANAGTSAPLRERCGFVNVALTCLCTTLWLGRRDRRGADGRSKLADQRRDATPRCGRDAAPVPAGRPDRSATAQGYQGTLSINGAAWRGSSAESDRFRPQLAPIAPCQGHIVNTYKQLLALVQAEHEVRVAAAMPTLHAIRTLLDKVAPEPVAAPGSASLSISSVASSATSTQATPHSARPPSPPLTAAVGPLQSAVPAPVVVGAAEVTTPAADGTLTTS